MGTYKYNQNVAKRFMDLKTQTEESDNIKIPSTYVWIDGTGQSLRSKTRTIVIDRKIWDKLTADEKLSRPIEEQRQLVIPKMFPKWDFCATGAGFETKKDEKGEIYSSCELRPRAVYMDPFHGGNARLVLCAVYYNNEPVKTNHREECWQALKKDQKQPKETVKENLIQNLGSKIAGEYYQPKFGIEQEYTLIDPKTNRPLGWPEDGFPAPQGPYYCSVGTGLAIGRDIAEAHYRACLYANIPIYGYNAEVMPGQWEFQVGECQGIQMGDDLWMARFILVRVAEEFGVKVSFDPKPVEGDWNGSGAHINVSTKYTSGEDGYKRILRMVEELEKSHNEAIAVYDPNLGKDNARRLTGKHETSNINEFACKVDDRFVSIRIPRSTKNGRTDYFEDRRPASNADPYKVITHLVQICCKDYILPLQPNE